MDFHFSAAGNGSKSVMIGPFMVEKTLSTEAEVAGRTARRARSLEMLGNATVIESRTLGFHISPEQPAVMWRAEDCSHTSCKIETHSRVYHSIYLHLHHNSHTGTLSWTPACSGDQPVLLCI